MPLSCLAVRTWSATLFTRAHRYTGCPVSPQDTHVFSGWVRGRDEGTWREWRNDVTSRIARGHVAWDTYSFSFSLCQDFFTSRTLRRWTWDSVDRRWKWQIGKPRWSSRCSPNARPRRPEPAGWRLFTITWIRRCSCQWELRFVKLLPFSQLLCEILKTCSFYSMLRLKFLQEG